jgi:non-ribosomal peptide synthetase component F
VVATPSEESFDAEVSMGKPAANCAVHVLDPWMQPVPCDVPGEVYVAGLHVARGYCADAALTAERFIADPFNSEPGTRLYRTGDLARFLPDGTLQYMGRIDSPLKTRGRRVNKRALPAPHVARTNKVLPIRVTFLQKPRENASGING